MTSNDYAPTTVGLFDAARRFWWLLVLAMCTAVGSGLLLSGLQETVYAASSKVVLDTAVPENVRGVEPSRQLLNEVERMRSPEVIARAMQLAAKDPEAPRLRGRLGVTSAPDLDLIKVTVRAPTAPSAAFLANTVVTAYQQVVLERRTAELDAQIAALEARRQPLAQRLASTRPNPGNLALTEQREADQRQLSAVEEQLDGLNLRRTVLDAGVETVEPARPPSEPDQPKPVRNAALGGVLGLLVGCALAWWRADRLAPVGSHGLHAELDAPKFASLPPRHGVLDRGGEVDLGPMSELGSVGRMTAAALLHRLDGTGQTVLITSLRRREGRTLTALTTALAVARSGRSVVVVDADPTSRGLSAATNAAASKGLSDLLSGRASVDDCLYRFPMEDVYGLWLVPAGTGELDPAGVTGADNARPLRRLAGRMDVTLIDGPPLLTSAQAVELAGSVDWVILVMTRDVSSEDVAEAKNRLKLLDAHLIGFVTNDDRNVSNKALSVRDMRALGEVPAGELTASRAEHHAPVTHPPEAPAPPRRRVDEPPPPLPPDEPPAQRRYDEAAAPRRAAPQDEAPDETPAEEPVEEEAQWARNGPAPRSDDDEPAPTLLGFRLRTGRR